MRRILLLLGLAFERRRVASVDSIVGARATQGILGFYRAFQRALRRCVLDLGCMSLTILDGHSLGVSNSFLPLGVVLVQLLEVHFNIC